jgi:TRAP transporter TAXI family solute receptor
MFKKLVLTSVPVLIILFITLILIIRHFNPAPPNHMVLATGDDQSDVQIFAKRYKEILKMDGVNLEIRPTKGPIENLKLLDDETSDVSAAFVPDGLGSEDQQPGILSLGSLYYEPIWIFYRSSHTFSHFSDLMKKKISVGKVGRANQVLTNRLLRMSGVDPQDAVLINMGSVESAEALKQGKIDVAILMLPPESAIIDDLSKQKDIKLMNFSQAEAISRKDPAFHHLILPRGAIDLELDIPKEDIHLLASTSTLLIKDDLHPSLVYLLLKAATEIHGASGIFEKRGEFPTSKDDAFSLSKDAIGFYKNGTPFWQRYLPYWLASWFDRFILLIIPILAFALPLIRIIPKVYHWRLRSKIYQRYGELLVLETQLKSNATQSEYDNFLVQLNLIESRVVSMNMPKNYSDYIYSLKGHIQFVRDRIEKTVSVK